MVINVNSLHGEAWGSYLSIYLKLMVKLLFMREDMKEKDGFVDADIIIYCYEKAS